MIDMKEWDNVGFESVRLESDCAELIQAILNPLEAAETALLYDADTGLTKKIHPTIFWLQRKTTLIKVQMQMPKRHFYHVYEAVLETCTPYW